VEAIDKCDILATLSQGTNLHYVRFQASDMK